MFDNKEKSTRLSHSKRLTPGVKMTSKRFEYFWLCHLFHSLFESLFQSFFSPFIFHTFNLFRLPLETLILPFETHFILWRVSWIMYVYNHYYKNCAVCFNIYILPLIPTGFWILDTRYFGRNSTEWIIWMLNTEHQVPCTVPK